MSLARFVFCFLVSLSLPAMSDASTIGYVKTVKGDAMVISGGNQVKAEVGTPVMNGSKLKTGTNASMGVTFKDNTVMSFGPNTELTVDEYVYSPNKGKLKLGATMAKGTLAYLSGAIAKIKPDAVTVKTPTGTIGVRGTHFVLKVDEE